MLLQTNRLIIFTFALLTPLFVSGAELKIPADDGKLRIVCFGAHPDDAEYKSGGTAALWAERGHHVLLVSVTNGDIGHWQMSGGGVGQTQNGRICGMCKTPRSSLESP